MNIFNNKFSHFRFDAVGGLVKYIKKIYFSLKFPSNVTDANSSVNVSSESSGNKSSICLDEYILTI